MLKTDDIELIRWRFRLVCCKTHLIYGIGSKIIASGITDYALLIALKWHMNVFCPKWCSMGDVVQIVPLLILYWLSSKTEYLVRYNNYHCKYATCIPSLVYFGAWAFILNSRFRLQKLGISDSAINHPSGCFWPWIIFQNSRFNFLSWNSFVSPLCFQLGCCEAFAWRIWSVPGMLWYSFLA